MADFLIDSLRGEASGEALLEKFCTKCKNTLPLSAFYFHKTRKLLNSWCRKCHAVDAQQRRKRWSPEKTRQFLRKQNLKHTFGLTPEEYNILLEEQGGVCAICKKPETAMLRGRVKNLAVDHIAGTSIIRGLLCGRCNTAIGLLQHDVLRCDAALAYLKKGR